MIDQFFRKLIKEDRSAAGPHSRPKSGRKASSHMLQASHIVVPSSCRWSGIARTCRAIDRHAHSSRAQHVPLSHAPLPVDSDAPESAPPRTGRAQSVHRGKRGTQWQAARDGHWLGCWRGVPRFYASDQACSHPRQGTLHVARRRSTAGAVSCDWECCVVRRASESAVMVSTSCCEQRSGARRAGGGQGGGGGVPRGHATGAAPSGSRARAVGPLQSTVLCLRARPHHGLHADGRLTRAQGGGGQACAD